MFGWKPGIGDPTIYGWLTVAAYALGAWCCWRAGSVGPRGERRFWLVLTAIMAFLCINKQLDLQTLGTDIARALAKKQGWYPERRTYQIAFIFGLGALTALATSTLLVRMRRARGSLRGASIGLALLLLFIFVRASSFEKTDLLIARQVGGIPVNTVLELGGIVIVTLFAWAAGRR